MQEFLTTLQDYSVIVQEFLQDMYNIVEDVSCKILEDTCIFLQGISVWDNSRYMPSSPQQSISPCFDEVCATLWHNRMHVASNSR